MSASLTNANLYRNRRAVWWHLPAAFSISLTQSWQSFIEAARSFNESPPLGYARFSTNVESSTWRVSWRHKYTAREIAVPFVFSTFTSIKEIG